MTAKCFLIDSSNRLVARQMLRFAVPSVKCQGPRLHMLMRTRTTSSTCAYASTSTYSRQNRVTIRCHLLFLKEVRSMRSGSVGPVLTNHSPHVVPTCSEMSKVATFLYIAGVLDDGPTGYRLQAPVRQVNIVSCVQDVAEGVDETEKPPLQGFQEAYTTCVKWLMAVFVFAWEQMLHSHVFGCVEMANLISQSMSPS